MAARGETLVASLHPDHETDDWIDREIASLRQSIEREAPRQKGRGLRAGRPPETRLIRPIPEAATDPVPSAVWRPPRAVLALRRARRFVRRRRFEIVFYGLCLAATTALVFVAVSLGER
jgi:hypothetical protein